MTTALTTTGSIIVMGWLEITALVVVTLFTCATVIVAYYMGLNEGLRKRPYRDDGNDGWGWYDDPPPWVPNDPSELVEDYSDTMA